MTILLQGNDDPDFVAHLKHARTETVLYEGYLDGSIRYVNSAMDIGSFLQVFNSFCDPVSSSQLRTVLDKASAAYSAMFVVAGVGEGTSAGTGMHITWVSEQEYASDTSYYKPILFDEKTTDELPNYLAFLATFYDTPTPGQQTSTSPVCQISLAPGRLPIDEAELLLDPGLYSSENEAVIHSQITRNVDYVLVEYGFDVTNLLSEDLGQKLHESLHKNEARQLRDGHDQPCCRSRHSLMKYGPMNRMRREQEEGDLFLIYGGDVAYVYDGANVTATWDRIFYYLVSGTTIEPAYVYDDGDGAKSIPVCYFGPDNPITEEDIPFGTLMDDAVANNGCEVGYRTFFSSSSQELSLYVYQGVDATVLSQIPSFIGGQIVPVVHILYDVAGEQYDELLGGFNASIFEWGIDTDMEVYAVDDGIIHEAFESATILVDIFAYDFDASISDYEIFTVEQEDPPVGAPQQRMRNDEQKEKGKGSKWRNTE